MHKLSWSETPGLFWASAGIDSASTGWWREVPMGVQAHSSEPAACQRLKHRKSGLRVAVQQRKFVQTC
jgi:hypothetical protein